MKKRNRNPTFRSAVLLVKDVEKSKRFYNVVLGQKIIMDFGRNVGFEGGLAIWDREYALDLIFQKKKQDVKSGANDVEIYFEVEDLDSLYEQLSREEIEIIHSIREQPWGQRVFRAYDLDKYIIEFAESMESVILRLGTQGFGLEEIAMKSEMPMDVIKLVLQKH